MYVCVARIGRSGWVNSKRGSAYDRNGRKGGKESSRFAVRVDRVVSHVCLLLTFRNRNVGEESCPLHSLAKMGRGKEG